MKKIFKCVFVCACAILLVGCKNTNKDVPKDIDVLDSKIDYFVYKNKKIYLTEDYKKYASQFKGLGCKIGNTIEIDSINFDETSVEDLAEYSRGNLDITCPDLNSSWSPEFGTLISYDEPTKYQIYSWNCIHVDGIDLYIDGTKITIGDESNDSNSDMDKLIKILGDDYEVEYDDDLIDAIIYKIDGIKYSFFLDNSLFSSVQSEEIDWFSIVK